MTTSPFSLPVDDAPDSGGRISGVHEIPPSKPVIVQGSGSPEEHAAYVDALTARGLTIAEDSQPGDVIAVGCDQDGVTVRWSTVDPPARLSRSIAANDLAAFVHVAARLSERPVTTDSLPRLSRSEPFLERVRVAVTATLRSGRPSLVATARELRASPRTLQRRLERLGTSYANLVQEVRCALAVQLMENEHASIPEIAFSLGFSDVSSFRRAYKRWTGAPPLQARPG